MKTCLYGGSQTLPWYETVNMSCPLLSSQEVSGDQLLGTVPFALPR